MERKSGDVERLLDRLRVVARKLLPVAKEDLGGIDASRKEARRSRLARECGPEPAGRLDDGKAAGLAVPGGNDRRGRRDAVSQTRTNGSFQGEAPLSVTDRRKRGGEEEGVAVGKKRRRGPPWAA
jgi:hypothetical protein